MIRDATWFQDRYFCGFCGIYIHRTDSKAITINKRKQIVHSYCKRILRNSSHVKVENSRKRYHRKVQNSFHIKPKGLRAEILANKEKWEKLIA